MKAMLSILFKRRLFILCGTLLFLFSSTSIYAQNLPIQEDSFASYYMANEFASDSRLAFILNQNLVEYFDETYRSRYPNSYGGTYIDDEQSLVICYTEDHGSAEYQQIFTNAVVASAKAEFFNLIEVSETSSVCAAYNEKEVLKYKSVTYSYNTLMSILACLQVKIEEFSIQGISLRQKNNSIYVYVDESRINEINTYVCDYFQRDVTPAITYITNLPKRCNAADETENLASSNLTNSNSSATRYLYPGNAIFTAYRGTVGFNAYNYETGQSGVVTCEHCVNKYEHAEDLNDYPINDVLLPTNVVSETLDASFVPFTTSEDFTWATSSYTLLPNAVSGTHIYGIVSNNSYVENATVYKLGVRTNKTAGKIISTHFVDSTDPPRLETSCFSLKGDSGGPVVVQSSINANYYDLVGISTELSYYGEYLGEDFLFDRSFVLPIKPLLFTLSLDLVCLSNPYCIGDVNNDGTVNSTDSDLVLSYYMGKVSFTAAQIAAADVDMDKQITTTDARLILQKVDGNLPWLI